MKFLRPFENMRQRRALVTALRYKLEEAETLPDPAARLLRYQAIKDTSEQLLAQFKGKTVVPGLGASALGLTAVGLSLSLFSLPLLLAGFGASLTGANMLAKGSQPKNWVLSPALRKDCKALESVAQRAAAALDEMVQKADLAEVARSPQCDQAVAAIPALKDRFMLAAAKDRLLQDRFPPRPAAPDAPGPDPAP